MSSSTPGTYSHSGTIGSALFIVPVAALILALALGTVYAYVDVYSPIAGYVSLLFVAGFAFGLGWSISKIGYVARCRSSVFLCIVGLVAGLIGLYSSWAVFEYALLKRYTEGFDATLLDFFLSPAGMWELAREINAEGWYTIHGMAPKGMVLWVVWGIEAIAVVVGTAFFAMAAISEEVFCERCGRWTSRLAGKVRLAFPENKDKLSALAPEDLGPLEALVTVTAAENPHLRIDTWACADCKGSHAIQLKIHTTLVGKKGKPEEQIEDVTPIWSVASHTFQRLSALAVRQPRELQAPVRHPRSATSSPGSG